MLFVAPMFLTIQKVKNILAQEIIPHFNWEGLTYLPYTSNSYEYLRDFMATAICHKCKKPTPFTDTMVVRSADGSSIHRYCIDCIPEGGINFCSFCDMPYEEEGGDLSDGICPYCLANGGYFGANVNKT